MSLGEKEWKGGASAIRTKLKRIPMTEIRTEACRDESGKKQDGKQQSRVEQCRKVLLSTVKSSEVEWRENRFGEMK